MKQTAVEWLYERLERMIPRSALYDIDKREYFKQAKEMEKEQMVELWNKAVTCELFEQYYNETFKSE
jgi:hypothetical protein